MSRFAIRTAVALLTLAAALLLIACYTQPTATSGGGVREIPTLTVWGKIFSVLLLAALGVAYLVWRRPVARAQAILETSPLGVDHPTPPLVDWRLYFKTLLVIEGLALVGLWVARFVARPLTRTDSLGVIGSAAIIALVVHLLILARYGGGRDA